ncbi:hypothetical protein TWF569_003168 [Orbilia oligospora]|uniref:Uncharacterized protein n=1 Tax=Orbilia oligospora TaxID=2813651 RepID=A0A7C8NEB9_ORBOL|nr:hypothetical protein TWF706_010424 [Orbilia oligospora]KAF3098951.1 hypothetical protein TWF102_005988 [Orbilia oligospora]KAF3108217.1 hypothetical protein TWF103_005760 [Orbilia oligospora]KAF3124312.1 hypothetical protein TWF594_002061 [Orbilia oligospora]KAF3124522.1 hypothetical protein TWF703_011275 [Orbilia oligospora]
MLFSSKAFLISAIALATPSLAALNWDQTLMILKLGQMGTADTATKNIVNTSGAGSIMVQNYMQDSINDQAYVVSKGKSGGAINANMPLDASAITTAFNSWAPYHKDLINSLKAQSALIQDPFFTGFRAGLQLDLASTILVSGQLQAMMPGSGYATARADILATANALCKAQKQAITAYGGSPTGGANTCA